jgi:hypothetical protein
MHPSHIPAQGRVIDLNVWHHAIHQVAGDMALRFRRLRFRLPAPAEQIQRTEAETAGFRERVVRLGLAAGFAFAGFDSLVHGHLLRHAAGFKLANDGYPVAAGLAHDALHGVGAAARNEDFWRDPLTGDAALRCNRATPADLRRWANKRWRTGELRAPPASRTTATKRLDYT